MGLLCPTSQGAFSFMFVHTMDTTGIYHTTECMFLAPCWCMPVTEKLIKSGSWCLPLLQRMEFSKVWWPSSRWHLSSHVSRLSHHHSSISTSCSPDSRYLCVYPPPAPLSFPPFPTPSMPDHSSSCTCLPQFLLKQHSAAVLLMKVMRKPEQDKPRLSEISPRCYTQGWEFVWPIKWDSLDLKANQKFLPDLKYLRIKEFPLSSLSGSSVLSKALKRLFSHVKNSWILKFFVCQSRWALVSLGTAVKSLAGTTTPALSSNCLSWVCWQRNWDLGKGSQGAAGLFSQVPLTH